MRFFDRKKKMQGPDDENIIIAVDTLLRAKTWADRRKIVETQNDHLLTDRASQILAEKLFDADNDLELQDKIRECAKYLEYCRTEGIEAASDKFAPQTRSSPSLELSSPKSEQSPLFASRNSLSQAEIYNENGRESLHQELSSLMSSDYLRDIPRRIEILLELLEEIDHSEQPEHWAAFHGELGNCLQRNPQGNRTENIEEAIKHHQLAFEVYTRNDYPLDWATNHNNLALDYSERICGKSIENLEKGIWHCDQALEIVHQENSPELWAEVNMNRALLLTERISGNRAEDIERAISHCESALRVFTCQEFSEQWARTNHTLARCYSDRIRGERTENLELAINHFELALEVYTPESFPDYWVLTQIGLGGVRLARFKGDRTKNIEQAIHHYELAEQIRNRRNFPQEWALISSNLAIAYWNYTQPSRADREDNLERAIQYSLQSLEVFTRESFPREWASTHNNLGGIFLDQIKRDPTENIEKAISHFQQALEVYTQEQFPELWARTHSNLATAYSEQHCDNRIGNLRKVIHHHNLAREVITLERFPSLYQRLMQNLGNAFFRERNWEEAYQAYEEAIEAENILAVSAYTEAGRQAEIGKISRMFKDAAYCLLKMARYIDALQTIEKGRARLLTEAMVFGDADTSLLSDVQCQELLHTRQKVRDIEAEMRLPLDVPDRRNERILAELLRQTRLDLNHLIESVRSKTPEFMPMGLDFPRISAIIPEDAVLVTPLVTSQGSAVIFVPSGAETLPSDNVIWLDDFSESDLQTLLGGSETKFGWLAFAYPDQRIQTEIITKNIHEIFSTNTGQLWNVLVKGIYKKISELKVKRVILMPSGGLQLLPLHAAWREIKGTKRYFMEDYEISYIPSAHILDICQRQAVKRQRKTALVAGIGEYEDNDLNSLDYAPSEAEVVAQIFNTKSLTDSQATKAAITTRLVGSAYIHLACHGAFNWQGNALEARLELFDKPLTLSELISGSTSDSGIDFNLDTARLVTLSACETGITDIFRLPEEFVGLPAGFLQARVPGIISSLWTVDDASTLLLMMRFYQNHLQEGMPPAKALQGAQLWLRDATRKELGDYCMSLIHQGIPNALSLYITIIAGDLEQKPYTEIFFWAPFIFNGT